MSFELPVGQLKKPKSGAGGPSFSNSRPVYAIPVDMFTENGYPATDEKKVRMLENIVLQAGAVPFDLYLTSGTKDYTVEVEGDQDAESFKKKVVGNFPGDETEATEFAVNNLAKGFVLVAGKCKSGLASKVIGDLCNPLYLKPSFQANNQKTGFVFTFEQTNGDEHMHRDYFGTLPTEETVSPVFPPTAIQVLASDYNVVKVAVGTASTVIAFTSVTKDADAVFTVVGQDVDSTKAGTLSSTTDFVGNIIVLLKNGVSWKSLAGASISFKVFKNGTKTFLIETNRK
ncbi:hypothetical protein [Chryseobacterium sp. FH1]|uniref:hypothetical protein n=1 Tax=Chryseobacterium sp. FH1 TaxID=1233951 RepID=UPI0004E34F7F|nr:hypothetical protein [Chryseobacterium sp. FH1]KFC19368.1 hypothetical protein IO90_08675 [Chryseobacterium sp. FH1]